ncbi:MAG TPA: PKD domain-containing protein [Thermoplasmata archaeon]|nr:PKD domain-containing protein [Thermoplasmata archaeon]
MRPRFDRTSGSNPPRIAAARAALLVLFSAMLVFSGYGTLSPAPVRCGLPGAVGCPGGLLGPAVGPATSGTQWFTVTLYDYGFWIVDSTTGANESLAWNVFEGWTVHVNATSLSPNAAVGGTAYHGLGVEINATGQQLLSLAAPVGSWTPGSFVAPLAVYHHQHLWCTIQCGPGHGGQQAWVLNVIPAVPLPKASAISNVSAGRVPLTVSFTGTPSAGTAPYNSTWDFGDGSPLGFGLTTAHTYALGGDYDAQYRVTDAKGMVAVSSVKILVNSSDPLRAVITVAPGAGVAPLTSALGLVAHGGAPPYTFSWSFGDGTPSPTANLSQHVFASPGVYGIVGTVRDASGASVHALASVTASPPLGYFPVSIAANPPNGSAPIIVQLSATPQGGVAPYSYLWVFGDGSTGVGPSPAHQFNLTGSYEVNLFVSDAAGHVGSAALNLPLVAPTIGGGGGGGDELPVGGLAGAAAAANGTLTIFPLATPRDGGTPLRVNASASIEAGSGLGENISWNFGDGTTGSGATVSHQFAGVGTYTVTVSASDSAGNRGTNRTVVRVDPLEMTLVANRSASDPPFSVTAAASILGGSGRYGVVSWSWGDGTSSTGALVNHTYPANATGAIELQATATDSLGQLVTASLPFQVNPDLAVAIQFAPPTSRLPPVIVAFTLHTSGGSGQFAALPLWDFGDGSSTRAGNATSHSFTKLGEYRIVVVTNDSLGTVVNATVWLNLSVTPASSPGRLGGPPPFSFRGVADPDKAALIFIGVVAATGLLMLARRRHASTGRPRATSTATPSDPPARASGAARATPRTAATPRPTTGGRAAPPRPPAGPVR